MSTGRPLDHSALLEELSRHAGHADIIREHIDGATTYELMAGVQGWPDTDWLTPYRPPVEAGVTPHGGDAQSERTERVTT